MKAFAIFLFGVLGVVAVLMPELLRDPSLAFPRADELEDQDPSVK